MQQKGVSVVGIMAAIGLVLGISLFIVYFAIEFFSGKTIYTSPPLTVVGTRGISNNQTVKLTSAGNPFRFFLTVTYTSQRCPIDQTLFSYTYVIKDSQEVVIKQADGRSTCTSQSENNQNPSIMSFPAPTTTNMGLDSFTIPSDGVYTLTVTVKNASLDTMTTQINSFGFSIKSNTSIPSPLMPISGAIFVVISAIIALMQARKNPPVTQPVQPTIPPELPIIPPAVQS